MLEAPFNKVEGLEAYNFIKKKPQHKCFPVKFAKFLRIIILKNICEWLLLNIKNKIILSTADTQESSIKIIREHCSF